MGNKKIDKFNVIFLGTGASEGVPVIGCSCNTCKVSIQKGGKHLRQRPSILASFGNVNIVVDSGPDIRNQLISAGNKPIHLLILTHWHYDHFGGIAEFMYYDRHGEKRTEIPMISSEYTIAAYDRYINNLLPFGDKIPDKNRPILLPKQVDFKKNLKLGELEIRFFSLPHGIQGNFNCRIDSPNGGIALLWDTGPGVSKEAIEIIKGAKIGVIEAAYPDNMPASPKHFREAEAIEFGKKLGWEKIYLTHISHFSKPHDELDKYVKKIGGDNVFVGYDGLQLSL